MCPELLDPDQFGIKDSRPTKESDCYALGMVILEVLSGKAPFAPLKDPAIIWKVIKGERPGRPRGTKGERFTDDLWRTLEQCWSSEPEDRPSVEAVLEHLEGLSVTWKSPPSRVGDDLQTDSGDKPRSTASYIRTPYFASSHIFVLNCPMQRTSQSREEQFACPSRYRHLEFGRGEFVEELLYPIHPIRVATHPRNCITLLAFPFPVSKVLWARRQPTKVRVAFRYFLAVPLKIKWRPGRNYRPSFGTRSLRRVLRCPTFWLGDRSSPTPNIVFSRKNTPNIFP